MNLLMVLGGGGGGGKKKKFKINFLIAPKQIWIAWNKKLI
jgi:hypothetical protein